MRFRRALFTFIRLTRGLRSPATSRGKTGGNFYLKYITRTRVILLRVRVTRRRNTRERRARRTRSRFFLSRSFSLANAIPTEMSRARPSVAKNATRGEGGWGRGNIRVRQCADVLLSFAGKSREFLALPRPLGPLFRIESPHYSRSISPRFM